MKYLKVIFLFFIINSSQSQELYINTEPASLIPKGTKVVRLHHHTIFLNENNEPGSFTSARLTIPSISYGISKKVMISASLQFSNNPYELSSNFGFNGFKLYSKQRLISTDKKKYHTRLSSFIKYSNHGKWNQPNYKFISNNYDLDSQDSGVEVGLIITQLVNKLAISVTSGFGIISNKTADGSYDDKNFNSIHNSISAGYLLFPRKYKSYKQTNFNIYLEYLTSTIIGKEFPSRYENFMSTFAPGIQFIIMSRSRLDFGYKIRNNKSPNEFLVKLTYIIY
ncbi:MAG: hypothetical protein CL870_04235 [Cytophagia bacterium]|jgi:hypothetical protein|nr:hypothetical protein [Cytophagia bacterium]